MNLSRLDPKLIVLAAAVIVIIALFAWLYMRNRRNKSPACDKSSAPSTTAQS